MCLIDCSRVWGIIDEPATIFAMPTADSQFFAPLLQATMQRFLIEKPSRSHDYYHDFVSIIVYQNSSFEPWPVADTLSTRSQIDVSFNSLYQSAFRYRLIIMRSTRNVVASVILRMLSIFGVHQLFLIEVFCTGALNTKM